MLRCQEIDWFGFLSQKNKYVSVCGRVCVLCSLARRYNSFYLILINRLLQIKCRYNFLLFLLNLLHRHRNFTTRHQLQNVEDYPPFPTRQRKQQILQGHCFLLVKLHVVTCLKTPLHITNFIVSMCILIH
jgi:hypothetical protein